MLGTTIAFGALAASASSASATVTIQGQWQCRDRGVTMPIRGAMVELHETGLFGNHLTASVATAFTDDNGNYSLTTNNGGDHFVRLVLRDAQGVHLNDSIVPWDWYTDSGTFNAGQGLNLVGGDLITDTGTRTPVCAPWQGVHDSFLDYESALGEPPPYGDDLLVRGNFPTPGGVPFTVESTIQWPPGFATGSVGGDFTIARHEFGHSFRQVFDGDIPHFFNDVVTFAYAQNHVHCGQVTNPGFAFNEGWADFWSGDTSPCDSDPEAHPDVEGDVAASLANLQAHCNDTRADMVHALQAGPLQIHSFAEYQEFLSRCVPTPTPSSTPTPTFSGGLEDQPDYGAIVQYFRSRMSHMHHAIRALTGELNTTHRADLKLPKCSGKRCDRELLPTLLPALLSGQIASLKLESTALAPYGNRSMLLLLAKRSEIQEIHADIRMIASFASHIKRIDRATLGGMMHAVADRLRVDHSSTARQFADTLRHLIKQAATGTIDADLLNIGTPPGTTVHKVKPRQFAAPNPFGGIFVPTAVVSLSCPGKATLGMPLKVSGELSPARPSATVSVTYSRENANPAEVITHKVSTDPTGSFADSITPDNAGRWDIQAAYAGDSQYEGSSSPVCSSFVAPQ